MTNNPAFLNGDEATLASQFLEQGYVIIESEDVGISQRMQQAVADLAAEHLGEKSPDNAGDFLNAIHDHVTPSSLNALRLAVIGGLRNAEWFRPGYYSLVKNALSTLVGSELAMQRGTGLSVQMPNDHSSILPLHADVWDGDSSFEVVVWVPLVNCFQTKSMFLVPLKRDRELQQNMAALQGKDVEALYKTVEEDVVFINIPFGSVLIFSQTLMHGNRLNTENESRWTLNCRFKSLLSPYADKKLGEFFEPITLKPATRMGTDYRMPEGFDE